MDVSINGEGTNPTLENVLRKCDLNEDQWDVTEYNVSLSSEDKWWARISCKPKLSSLDYKEIVDDLTEYIGNLLFVPHLLKQEYKARDTVLELGLYDTHLGLSDNSICISEISKFMNRLRPSEVVLPIAGDIFHFDNKKQTTTRGTYVGDEDTITWHDAVKQGYSEITKLIETLAYFAKVRVLVIPGNHDEHTTFSLGLFLDTVFRTRAGDVHIDARKNKFKYLSVGTTLIGFAHGDSFSRKTNLPALMANDVPEMWSQSERREIHHGHWHAEEVREDTGVILRAVPALSRLSQWEYDQNYRRQPRLQGYEWDLEKGLIGIYPIWM